MDGSVESESGSGREERVSSGRVVVGVRVGVGWEWGSGSGGVGVGVRVGVPSLPQNGTPKQCRGTPKKNHPKPPLLNEGAARAGETGREARRRPGARTHVP